MVLWCFDIVGTRAIIALHYPRQLLTVTRKMQSGLNMLNPKITVRQKHIIHILSCKLPADILQR